jgi:hypothetical protein
MKAVKAPNTVIVIKEILQRSIIGEHLIIKNTPAVTIVAACIKADTGVGPSIASGNQVCKPIWADLPKAPKKIKKFIRVITFTLKPKKKVFSLIK